MLTALKYFYENAPEYAIVAAGSLLGMGMHGGKVNVLEVDARHFLVEQSAVLEK